MGRGGIAWREEVARRVAGGTGLGQLASPAAVGVVFKVPTVEEPITVSIIEHVMVAPGYCQMDLAAVSGSQRHASEVLNRRRP